MDGEVLTGNFIRPAGEDNPDYTRCVFTPHAGPLVTLQVSPRISDAICQLNLASSTTAPATACSIPFVISAVLRTSIDPVLVTWA